MSRNFELPALRCRYDYSLAAAHQADESYVSMLRLVERDNGNVAIF